jgi:hypothetical protein
MTDRQALETLREAARQAAEAIELMLTECDLRSVSAKGIAALVELTVALDQTEAVS